MANKKIIIGNWKMAPGTAREAVSTFIAIKKTASALRNVQTIVCPSFIHLSEIKKFSGGHRCVLGAQDCFWKSNEDAHTGEVSPKMLHALGVTYVIVGHSERRALGETDSVVSKKVIAGVKDGLGVILCIGEMERDEAGAYTAFLKRELMASLAGFSRKMLTSLIVAYEPIWAIGKKAKRPASPEDALEVAILIKKILTDRYGKTAMSVPVLYGGSVNPGNAESFLSDGGVDGLLVGRASLDAGAFGEILRIANAIK